MRFLDVCRFVLVMGLLLAFRPAVPGEAATTPAQQASSQVALPQPLTREAIRELVARLSDAEVRQLLLAQLDKAAAPETAAKSAPMAENMQAETQQMRTRLGEVFASAARLPEVLSAAYSRLTEGRSETHLLLVALLFGAMLAVGWGAERLYLRIAGDLHKRLKEREAMGLAAQAGVLLLRLALDLVALLAFTVSALAVFFVLWPEHVPTRELVIAALLAALLVRLVALVGRFLLAPATPALRLLPFDDATARRIQAGLVRFAVAYAVGRIVILDLLDRMGAPREVLLFPLLVLGLLFAGLFIHMVWQNRAPVAALIRGTGDAGPLRRILAGAWPALMTAYVGIIFFAVVVERLSDRQIGSHAGIISLLIVVLLPLADMTLCRVLPPAMGWRPGGAEGRAASTREAYEPLLRQGIHIVVTVVALFLLARTWGLDLFSLAQRGVGERLTRAVIDSAIALLVAYFAWQLLKTAIDRRLKQETIPAGAKDMGDEIGGGGGSRAHTLLPLIRMFLFISLCVMATLIVLAAVGVNITPLLAGAGVVGLAVGFGSQALVRDITSGLFFLIDDAFRVGEYIDVGDDVMGTVEKISVRSMQLRHHRGPLNTVPYGGIRRLINHSRDWAIMKLDFRLTYDTDLVKVKKILKRIGQEMMEDPDIGPHLLEPLKSQGVTKADDSALIFRAKFKAKPDEQFVIRREAYARVLKAFEENGIKFAHRQVTVFLPPGSAGVVTPAVAAAAGAAASAASEAAKEDGSSRS